MCPQENNTNAKDKDLLHGGREKYWLDVDRMTNEGLAGGYITNKENGEIDKTTEIEPESPPRKLNQ